MASFSEDYSNFDAQEYMSNSYKENTPKKKLFEYLYQDFVDSANGGGRFLEMSSGPSVCIGLLASRFYNDITLAEYAKPNREQLEKWINNENDAHDWTMMANFIGSLEGSDPETVISRGRKAVKQVIPCDLKNESPLLENRSNNYDCIVTLDGLECATHDMESYKNGLKNIYNLVKPGGKFILFGTDNASFYIVGNKKYNIFKIGVKEVLPIIKELCSPDDIQVKLATMSNFGVNVDANDFFFISVRKPLEKN